MVCHASTVPAKARRQGPFVAFEVGFYAFVAVLSQVTPLGELAWWQVMVGNLIAAAAMGDPNASIPTPQPVHYRPMFGAYGGAIARGSLTFVSQAGLAAGLGGRPLVVSVSGDGGYNEVVNGVMDAGNDRAVSAVRAAGTRSTSSAPRRRSGSASSRRRPRSPRSTPTPLGSRRPTGSRSWSGTTSCCASPTHPSSGSIASTWKVTGCPSRTQPMSDSSMLAVTRAGPERAGGGEAAPESGRLRLCPYFFVRGDRAELSGALATFCPPDKKIIHGMQDAALLPSEVSTLS